MDWLLGEFGGAVVGSLIEADEQTVTARSAAVKVKIELHNTYRIDEYVGGEYDSSVYPNAAMVSASFSIETPDSGPYYKTVEECCEEAE